MPMPLPSQLSLAAPSFSEMGSPSPLGMPSQTSSVAGEDQARSLYHGSRLCWVTLHLSGTIQVANDAAMDFLKLKPEDVQYGSQSNVSFLDAVHPDDSAELYRDLHSLLNRDYISCSNRKRVKVADGKFAIVNMLFCLRVDTEERVQGYECIFMPVV